jgi:hypothetical protein
MMQLKLDPKIGTGTSNVKVRIQFVVSNDADEGVGFLILGGTKGASNVELAKTCVNWIELTFQKPTALSS